MKGVFVISFASTDFETFRQEMNASALKYGLDHFFSYDENWLKKTEFYKKNLKIFNHKKGYGFWLWKPFIISESLKKVNDNDIVFYIDSGSLVLLDPTPLIEISKVNKSGIVAFNCLPLTNQQWTKREVFVEMDLDTEEFWYAPHSIATVCLFRKTSFSINFVDEWLKECTKFNLISDTLNNHYPNIKGFIGHRHDQSVFSLLIKKHQIETYRNPSVWGNYLKMIEYRVKGELVCFPYLIKNTIKDYAIKPLHNSPYGTIFEFNRKQNQVLHTNKNRIRNFHRILFQKHSLVNHLNTLLKSALSQIFNKLGYAIHKKNLENKNLKKSFSQCGEDLLVQYIFYLRNISKPTYIDIGANDPFYLNNTALFYTNGCRGINVEANPALLENFKKNRPDDVNLNIGIAAQESTLDFYVINDPTLSSFSKEECEKFIATGKYHITNTLKIKVTTIRKILDEFNNGVFPDFLTLDAEGMDFEILRTIDYTNNAPKVICVEVADYSPIGAGELRTELIDFLVENGYYEYANTNLNAIMVKREFWFI
jgi:FkbM family methyltransferase